MCISTYTYIIYTHIYTRVCILHMNICIYMHIHSYMYMYLYIHTYMHTYKHAYIIYTQIKNINKIAIKYTYNTYYMYSFTYI